MGVQKKGPPPPKKKLQSPTPTLVMHIIYDSFLRIFFFYIVLQFDPNGRQCLTMAGYRRLGQIIRNQADLYSDGRVLLVQEGGYHLTYSAYCLHATLEGILKLPSPLLHDPMAYYPEDYELSMAAISNIKTEWTKNCMDPNITH